MSVVILGAIAITMLLGTLGVLLLSALCVLRLARLFGPEPKRVVAHAERLRVREAPGWTT